jgi:hypothetical protein
MTVAMCAELNSEACRTPRGLVRSGSGHHGVHAGLGVALVDVSLLPCLADGFLLGWGDRAALERTDQEDSAQNGWQDLLQRSGSQWAQSSVALFDHQVRPQQERRRDRQAEGLGGLEIDDQLESTGLLDRQIARVCPFEKFVYVHSRPTP